MALAIRSPGVYVDIKESGSLPITGVGTSTTAFIGITRRTADGDAAGVLNVPTRITSWADFLRLYGGPVPGTCLAQSVQGYFENGGTDAFIVCVGYADAVFGAAAPAAAIGAPAPAVESGKKGGKAAATEGAEGAADDAGPSTAVVPAPSTEVVVAATGPVAAVTTGRLGLSGGSDGDGYLVTPVGPLGNEIKVVLEPEAASNGKATYKVTVTAGSAPETFAGLTLTGGATEVTSVVNAGSKLVRLTAPARLPRALERGEVTVSFAALSTAAFLGDPLEQSGLAGLEAVDEVTIVCVPDIMYFLASGYIDATQATDLQGKVVAHCERMGDRLAIVDPPPGLGADAVASWLNDSPNLDTSYGALYWPWLQVADPAATKGSKPLLIPPSGHIAGLWSRVDATRGVHKAPANETVLGIVGLARNVSRLEHDMHADPPTNLRVNVIRSFPGRGIRVWGARTLSSNPTWRYVNVRRYFNYLKESILFGTQWAVFEPNDVDLWGRVERTIEAFLVLEWRKGALFGLTPAEAYQVQCDAATNSRETIDAGQVICKVAVAPVKPAEFVIFELSQFSGGAAIAE